MIILREMFTKISYYRKHVWQTDKYSTKYQILWFSVMSDFYSKNCFEKDFVLHHAFVVFCAQVSFLMHENIDSTSV